MLEFVLLHPERAFGIKTLFGFFKLEILFATAVIRILVELNVTEATQNFAIRIFGLLSATSRIQSHELRR